MRRYIAVLFVFAWTCLPTLVAAQVSEGGCRLFSHTGSSRDMVYVASAELLKALPCPANIRTAATEYGFFAYTHEEAKQAGIEQSEKTLFYKGKSVIEIFKSTVQDSDRYVLLRVERVIHPDFNRTAVYWFDYIERTSVRGLR